MTKKTSPTWQEKQISKHQKHRKPPQKKKTKRTTQKQHWEGSSKQKQRQCDLQGSKKNVHMRNPIRLSSWFLKETYRPVGITQHFQRAKKEKITNKNICLVRLSVRMKEIKSKTEGSLSPFQTRHAIHVKEIYF